ncbi:MAG TPA: cache domain-containing protein [Chitinophagaceae bacterium]
MRKHQLLTILLLMAGLYTYAQESEDEGSSSSLYSRFTVVNPEDSTQKVIALVKDASALVRTKGEAAFTDFRLQGSRWRQGETYIFVLDPGGMMLVHDDPLMEGKNQLDLKDINGKPIIRGLIAAATSFPNKPEGWYHYEWPVPGGLSPRWKSSYVQLVKAPTGKSYIVGSGMYNDRMEREFVVDAVRNAVSELQKDKDNAFRLFHDPAGPFRAKDAYIFILDTNGVELVNPAHPILEGRNVLNLKDTRGKFLVQEMLKMARTRGSGWVDYMWPKPGESVSTQKSTYVSRAKMKAGWLAVGCGVYLAEAPKEISTTPRITAPELMTLVRQAAQVFEQSGESAFPDFRKKGFRWFMDDTYFFVFTMDGTRAFHAAESTSEGRNDLALKDVGGRPIVKMFLEAGATPEGEGWVHYQWPEPGDIFPAWKSSFVKRVTFPTGKQYIIGSGIYNMQMDKVFVEDVVSRAADLIAQRGKEAFPLLRDKTGPFVFLNNYVFVDDPQGVELVNGAQPGIEGRNLMDAKDLKGKPLVREYIDAATKNGSAWVDYYWYKPGENKPAHKQSYVRKVQHGNETYIVGSGLYLPDEERHQPR